MLAPHELDGAVTGNEQPLWWAASVERVAQCLDVDPAAGLTSRAARERLERIGRNELLQRDGPTLLERLRRQFADPLVLLLLIAIVVSLGAWSRSDESALPVEAIVIAVIVAANAVIGVWQEGKATQAVAALRCLTSPESTVIRDGRARKIPTALLVPGDVVTLVEGDIVGFDGRLIRSASLELDEAPLTGESVPVAKHPDALDEATAVAERTNMVMSGTAVARGRGTAIVCATGATTEVGRIARLLDEVDDEPTPLQRQVARLSRTLGVAVVALAVVVVAAIFVTSDVSSIDDATDALLVAVSLAVAAVPEGLPAIMSVVLALGVQRMSRRNAIVKRLLSVETLGSASVICTDKTGTLTRNEMMVVAVEVPKGRATVTGVGYEPVGDVEDIDGEGRDDVHRLLRAASIASDASLRHSDDGWTVSGDPTEIALVVAAAKTLPGWDPAVAASRLDEVPFDADRKLMSVLVRPHDDWLGTNSDVVQVTKGAPDVLLARCGHERRRHESRPVSEERRREIGSRVADLATTGLRTLGVAIRTRAEETRSIGLDDESDLTWLGAVGISDPPRREAAVVVARASDAGIRTIMATGDHPQTAAAIGSAVGLDRTEAPVIGTDLAELDWTDEISVDAVIEVTDVFARVAPEHKLRLVEALQRRGHVVAMTGDGVNDAPALRQADIGVAMGDVGTDVSREAADMVLADDDFATIVTAIEEGRNIFADIRKFLRYLLASNTGEVLVMVIGVLAAGALGLRVGDGLAVPLLATQILWINLVTDSALALALGVDPSVEDVMSEQPRQLSEPIVDRTMWVTIVVVGLTTATAGLIALDLELAGGLLGGDGDLATARTMLFTTVVLAQIFNAFNARSDRVSAFVRLFDNRLLWAAVAVTVALQVTVVHVAFLNRAFDTVPLGGVQWLTCAALASMVLVVNEVRKILAMRMRRRLGDDLRP